MMTTEYYLIENNQEIKIECEEIKKGQTIRQILKVDGEVKVNSRFITLTNPYEHKTMIYGIEHTTGLRVEARIPPSYKVFTIPL